MDVDVDHTEDLYADEESFFSVIFVRRHLSKGYLDTHRNQSFECDKCHIKEMFTQKPGTYSTKICSLVRIHLL